MKNAFLIACFFLLTACSSKEKYDIAKYYDVQEQDQVLTSIVTYIFDAPPYASLKDRFKPEHRNYYSSQASKFSISKYFVANDGTHYFYVVRPGPNTNEKRGVGGSFRMRANHELSDFREIFVTPLLPVEEVTGRCSFLFDEMIKGNIEKYREMGTFIQWPNKISCYDTITYQWKMKEEFNLPASN